MKSSNFSNSTSPGVLRPMRDVGDRGDQEERRERGRCSREIGEDDREERLCEFKVVVV